MGGTKGGREERRESGKEGEREEGREGGREGGRDEGRPREVIWTYSITGLMTHTACNILRWPTSLDNPAYYHIPSTSHPIQFAPSFPCGN